MPYCIDLTLTSVVFEFSRLEFHYHTRLNLTLTSVVFELGTVMGEVKGKVYLTLTSVVFECYHPKLGLFLIGVI